MSTESTNEKTDQKPRLRIPEAVRLAALAKVDALRDYLTSIAPAAVVSEQAAPREPCDPCGTLTSGQRAPAGDWRTWLCFGGRGSGRSHAGKAWIRGEVEIGKQRIAIVVPRPEDVVPMADEIASAFPDGQKPVYLPGKRALVFTSGAIAAIYDATHRDDIEGITHDAAYASDADLWDLADENGVGGAVNAADVLDALRKGMQGRMLITALSESSAPRATGMAFVSEPRTVITRLSPAWRIDPQTSRGAWIAPAERHEVAS